MPTEIPFLDRYRNREQQIVEENRQQESADLHNAGAVVSLTQAIQQLNDKQAEQQQHKEFIQRAAQLVPPQDRPAFMLDPKGYLAEQRKPHPLQQRDLGDRIIDVHPITGQQVGEARIKGQQPRALQNVDLGDSIIQVDALTGRQVGEARPKAAAPAAPTQLAKLLSERDALPVGHPTRALYDKAITEFKPGNSTNVTVSPTLQLGKEAGNKVDTGLLDTTKGIMQLSAIEGQFKPEYQQFLPRIGAAWAGIKSSMGANLSQNDSKFLTDFSSYKRNAINTMNEYIKSITGAAMSEQEAQRILRGMPNPGQGMLDGDSPIEFKSKLDDAMKQSKMALARYEYIKRNGIALSKADGSPVLDLERMPQIMNDRGKELEAQIKGSNSNLGNAQVTARVRSLLAKEFGLVQ